MEIVAPDSPTRERGLFSLSEFNARVNSFPNPGVGNLASIAASNRADARGMLSNTASVNTRHRVSR